MSQSEYAPRAHDSPLPYSEADFDDYRAAPLLLVGPSADPELIAVQDELAHKFNEVAHHKLSKYVKPEVVSFVGRSISTRMQQREGQNGSEYMRRLHPEVFCYEDVPTVPEEQVDEAVEKALWGLGSPRQNHIAHIALGMVAGEYANLTIIDDFRKDLDVPMWAEFSDLLGIDATPHHNQMSNFKILGFDRDIRRSSHVGAIRIGMKRDIGTLPDGTVVKDRTTAIVAPQHYSQFRHAEAVAIRDALLEQRDATVIPEFTRLVRWLIEESPDPGVVLARNITVYGFKQSTLDQLNALSGYRYNP